MRAHRRTPPAWPLCGRVRRRRVRRAPSQPILAHVGDGCDLRARQGREAGAREHAQHGRLFRIVGVVLVDAGVRPRRRRRPAHPWVRGAAARTLRRGTRRPAAAARARHAPHGCASAGASSSTSVPRIRPSRDARARGVRRRSIGKRAGQRRELGLRADVCAVNYGLRAPRRARLSHDSMPDVGGDPRAPLDAAPAFAEHLRGCARALRAAGCTTSCRRLRAFLASACRSRSCRGRGARRRGRPGGKPARPARGASAASASWIAPRSTSNPAPVSAETPTPARLGRRSGDRFARQLFGERELFFIDEVGFRQHDDRGGTSR